MKKVFCLISLLISWSGLSFAQPNKYALLIAIDKYQQPSVSSLAGSVNDIEDMKSVLIGKFDFPPGNIVTLKNSQATHAAIISAIQNHLIAKAKPGDIVVLDYSGHGSLMKAPPNKKISGVDETIVPYDSRDPAGKVFDISGSELHGLLVQLAAKTKNITFILDSCHSGTLLRDIDKDAPRVRTVPMDERTPPPLPDFATNERGLHEVSSEAVPPFVLIAAATSKESAFEHICGGKEHGAVTCFLSQQLRVAKPDATWRDVMDSVKASVTANYPAQHPQLEGALVDQRIFGGSVALTSTYVPVTAISGQQVTLGQGAVSGMTAGSTFDIYKPGTKRFEAPEKPIATVQLKTVSDFTSDARILTGGPVLPASRAVEKIHRYGRARLRVYLKQESSPTLQALNQALTDLSQIELVSVPAKCQVQLEETGGLISILTPDFKKLSAFKAITARSPKAVSQLTKDLQLWAKWSSVMLIGSATSGPSVKVDVKAGQNMTVSENDKVTIDVTNTSARDLYISILDLSTDGTIALIYPDVAGASELLKPGQLLSRNFSAFVAPGVPFVNDTIKVFASTKPTDVTSLTMDIPATQKKRGLDDESSDDIDPLSDLLAESIGVSRGLRPEGTLTADTTPTPNSSGAKTPPEPAKVADWTAVQKTIRINKKK